MTSTDIAEDQCWLFLLVDCVAKKPKFPEEKNCEEYCSVSEIFCKNVARVKLLANTRIYRRFQGREEPRV
jgi:hypothetical protein